MKVSALVLKLVVAAIVVTAALHPESNAKAEDGKPIVIEIRSLKFLPKVPNVNLGDVVVWKNMDIVPHTVTAKDDSWDSGGIEAGGEWKTVITEAMVRDYYCRFHPTMIASLSLEGQ